MRSLYTMRLEDANIIDGNLAAAPNDYVKNQHQYNLLHNDGGKWHFDERVRLRIVSMLSLLAIRNVTPKSTLFLGCRMGCEIQEFLKHFPTSKVLGVDVVPEFVETTKQRVADAIIGDMHALELADDSFDVVFTAQALEHCYNIDQAVAEMLRVASKAVYVSVPLEDAVSYKANPSHYAYTTNPICWVRPFEKYFPEWRLEWAAVTEEHIVFDMFFVRRAT